MTWVSRRAHSLINTIPQQAKVRSNTFAVFKLAQTCVCSEQPREGRKDEGDLRFREGDNNLISGEQEGRHGHIDNDAMKPIEDQNCHKDNTEQHKWY